MFIFKNKKYRYNLRKITGGGLLFLATIPLFSVGFSSWVIREVVDASGTITADNVDVTIVNCLTLTVNSIPYLKGAGFKGTTTVNETNESGETVSSTYDDYVSSYVISGTGSINYSNCIDGISSFKTLDDASYRKLSLFFSFSGPDGFIFTDFGFINSTSIYIAKKDLSYGGNKIDIFCQDPSDGTTIDKLLFSYKVTITDTNKTFPSLDEQLSIVANVNEYIEGTYQNE